MAISATDREFVRQRAQFACEYCGIREADAGNELTIDHFHPRARGGTDDLDNLVYSCIACNQYKHDYWPNSPQEPHLWNPRQQLFSLHFLRMNDGLLQPLSEAGTFTLHLLHLNRLPLVEYRQKRQQDQEHVEALTHLQALVQIYEQLLIQQSQLIAEQRALLEKQQTLLRRFIGQNF